MKESEMISELKLLQAHSAEMHLTATRLLEKIEGPVNKKKKGLSDSEKAKLIARRTKTMFRS